jgi:hypothetical protein
MAYREVTMVEVKEVVRLWVKGIPKKRIAAQLGLDPKTVRRYVAAAGGCGVRVEDGVAGVTDAIVAGVLSALRAPLVHEHGEAWHRCEEQRAPIEEWLRGGVRLSKVRRLLQRRGVQLPYSTLHRFAVAELGFGRKAATIPVADGKPGEEIQLDTGWMTMLEADERGRRRRFRAWIFTPQVSRFRFVYPCLRETTETAIEACEAAWAFYEGVFGVVVPDNTKAIVQTADPLEPRLNGTFLEYAQSRGFHVDAARARKPTYKARVERAVRDTRDDCFGGERVGDIEHAREIARVWCESEYGMRRHSTTQRMPHEHFMSVEKPALLSAPIAQYDVPIWCEPKVARDQHAQVARALYSLPTCFVRRRLRARADSLVVRFYDGDKLVKTHARQRPGGRATDPKDFPEHKTPYAMRDVAFLQRQAESHGEVIGLFAKALLDMPLPWTRMRAVSALLGLTKRWGDARVQEACVRALAADMTSIHRLARMIEHAAGVCGTGDAGAQRVLPLARFLRPAASYALAHASNDDARNNSADHEEGEKE